MILKQQIITVQKPAVFFFARSYLGKVPGGAPFSQRSERATACTIWMQIDNQISERTFFFSHAVRSKLAKERIEQKQNKLQIPNSKLKENAVRTESLTERQGMHQVRGDKGQRHRHRRGVIGCLPVARWHRAKVKLGWSRCH